MKQVNWGGSALGGIRDPRGKVNSGRELFARAHAQQAAAEQELADYAKIEPYLKKCLLDCMLNGTPITVLKAFNIFTEVFEKSETNENDVGRFKIGTKKIPAGTILVYERLDATLGQWIFKSMATGEEFEIYDSPKIALSPEREVQNPGWYGLLLGTQIYVDVKKVLDERDKSRQSP